MDPRKSMSADASYRETIDYLYGLQKYGIKFGLENTVALLKMMGDPHRQFRSVHIAGTNGKGSTAAFLASILAAAGLRVGLYTSPHLVSFTERIRINGKPIAEEKVVELARRVRNAYQRAVPGSEMSPTFFEVTTAAAFAYFAEEGVDIAVIEAGMGGRLDSTNVVTPLVSIITNIDLEHTEFLGKTLELIAAEKAGIIKHGVPVVTGVTQPGVMQVVQRHADAGQSRVYRLGRDFQPERARQVKPGRGQQFDYRGIDACSSGLEVQLAGRHQVENASLALAAVECLRSQGFAVDESGVRRGLGQACWEGRLEPVAQRPDVYLDGAHNPASAKVLARSLAGMKPDYRRLILVLGILGDKDIRGIISPLAPLADHIIVTKPEYARAMAITALAREVRSVHAAVEVRETVVQALEQARRRAGADDLILVTGSLYVVGEARAVMAVAPGQGRALSGLKG